MEIVFLQKNTNMGALGIFMAVTLFGFVVACLTIYSTKKDENWATAVPATTGHEYDDYKRNYEKSQ